MTLVAYQTPIDWESIILGPRALYVFVSVCVRPDGHHDNRDAQQRTAGSVETIKYSGKTIITDKMFCVHHCHDILLDLSFGFL